MATSNISASPLTLPLLKFSHASDPSAETSKFAWNHAVQDLFVVFGSFRPQSDAMTLKVVQGVQVMEYVDLQKKAAEANKMVDWGRQNGFEMRNEQLVISVLVRCPLLAIRYSMPECNKTRRLQLKFVSDADFHLALSFVESTGCRVTQSVPPQKQQVQTVPENVRLAYSGEPSSNRLGSSSSGTIGASEASKSNDTRATLNSLPQVTGPLGATSSNFQYTPRVEQNFSFNPRPPSQPQRSFTLPTTRDGDGHSQSSVHTGAMDTTTPLQQNMLNSLNTSKLRPLLPAQPHANQSTTQAPYQPYTPAPIQASLSSVPQLQRPPTAIPYSSPTAIPHAPPTTLPLQTSLPTSPSGDYDINGTPLPPRRALPFNKPRSRPPTSSLDLPPLPTPKFADPGSIRPASSSSGRPGTSRGAPALPEGVRNAPFASLTRAPSKLRGSQSVDDVEMEMEVDNAGNKTAAAGQNNSAHTPAAGAALSTNTPTSNTTISGSNTTPPDPAIAAAFERIVSHMSKHDVENLSSYANRPVEDRRALICNWILQHVADDSFLTLCEDMACTWQRVILGRSSAD